MFKDSRAYRFFDQVKQEVKKIVWPNKKELYTSLLVVIFTVLVFSFFCLFLDYVIHTFVQFLLNLGK